MSDVSDDDFACSETPLGLQRIAILVWSTVIWQDIKESYALGAYVWCLPTCFAWKNGLSSLVVEDDDDGDHNRFASGPNDGITIGYRNVIMLTVLLPKVVISLALWHEGVLFLLESTSIADLLLNSVALNFVMEIDDYVGSLFPDAGRPHYAHSSEFYPAHY